MFSLPKNIFPIIMGYNKKKRIPVQISSINFPDERTEIAFSTQYYEQKIGVKISILSKFTFQFHIFLDLITR